MQLSIFIAQLMGPALLVIGFVVVTDPQRVRTMAREVLQGEAFLFLAGLIALTVGLAIVNAHNVWVSDWRVIITIVGWLMVFGGAARLGFGRQIKALGAAMIDQVRLLTGIGCLTAGLGAWLSYVAYFS